MEKNILQLSSLYGMYMTAGSSKVNQKSASVSSLSYKEIFYSVQQTTAVDSYKKHLEETFSIKVTVAVVARDQRSLEEAGGKMSGRDVVIAPNILEKMALDADQAAYYEKKIRQFFDSIPILKQHFAAKNLTYEASGVIIHEDGKVTYIGGCEDSPERKAEVAQINALKQKRRLERFQAANQFSIEKISIRFISISVFQTQNNLQMQNNFFPELFV